MDFHLHKLWTGSEHHSSNEEQTAYHVRQLIISSPCWLVVVEVGGAHMANINVVVRILNTLFFAFWTLGADDATALRIRRRWEFLWETARPQG